MSTSLREANKTIKLNVSQSSVSYLARAATIIHTGSLLANPAVGYYGEYGVTDGRCAPIFAVENLRGGSTYETQYTLGDYVIGINARRGDIILARVFVGEPTAGISIGDFLTSYADATYQGCLWHRSLAPFPTWDRYLAMALEDKAYDPINKVYRMPVEIL